MIWSDDFPRLTEQNHRFTSPATPDYKGIYGEVAQFMKRSSAPKA